jgi:hypothetical protein
MLKKNRTLTTLGEARNESIGEDGWHALVDALQANNVLTALYTADCKIADGDARMMDQLLRRNCHAAVVCKRTALTEKLQRNGERMTRIDVYTDTKYVSSGGRVEFPWEDSQLCSLFTALCTNTHVTALNFDKVSAIQSDEVMKQFASMLQANRSITTIRMYHCAVDGSTLAQGLKQHPMLENLKLYEIKFAGGGMQAVLAALLECPALLSLELDWRRDPVPPAMSELCTLLLRLPSLRCLGLSYCALSGAPLRQLTDALSTNKQLHSLNLGYNSSR